MKISVAISNTKDYMIPQELNQARYLVIVDVDKMAIISTIQGEESNRDVFFAEQTVKWDCEAIISGQIEMEAFEVLAKNCVSRFQGSGFNAMEAVDLMEKYRLPIIRDYEGGNGCKGETAYEKEQAGLDCECENHHDD